MRDASLVAIQTDLQHQHFDFIVTFELITITFEIAIGTLGHWTRRGGYDAIRLQDVYKNTSD
jgi:hypothetical protein